MSFDSLFSQNMIKLLSELNISLILSTYQAGKVIILSSDGKNIYQLVRDFARPMGIAIYKDMMALAGALSVTIFRSDKNLAQTYPNKPNTYDAFFFPVAQNRTDFVDIHDIAFTNQGLIGVNTAFSALVKLDGNYSFNPIWQPPFITELTHEDRCHLNGMAIDNTNTIRYVTAFGESNIKEGWRDNKLKGGILIDVLTNEIILRGLAMPHSPRIYRGELYLLLSATEELIKVDLETKTYKVIAKVDGFIRGLSFKDDYAFIGVSKLRKSHTFGDLDITKKKIQAGVVAVNLITNEVEGEIKYESDVEEIYDVHVLNGIKRANILNYQQSLNMRALITPFGSKWIENIKERDKENKK